MEDLGEVGVLTHPVAAAADVDDVTVVQEPTAGNSRPKPSTDTAMRGARRQPDYTRSSFGKPSALSPTNC